MKKTILFLTVLIMVCTVVFAGGGSQGSSVVRWSYWGGENRIRMTQLGIDVFTEETGIIVAGEPAPGTTEHFQKFLTQLAGGNAADIVQLGGFFSNLGIDDNGRSSPNLQNYLMPLDDFVRRGIINTSQLDAAAIQLGTRDGVLYALPLGMNMPAFIYNKSALERAGAPLPNVSMSWAEFEAWMRQVQPRLPANTWVLTDYSATLGGSFFFGYWAGDNGTPLYDGTRTHLTAADVTRYFNLWDGWRSAGLIPPAATSATYSEQNESQAAIIAGRTIVTAIWSNQLINYQNATTDELGLIEFPNAAVNNGLWSQASQMMGISRASRNGEAAARFINFRVTDPRAWSFTGPDPGVPSTPATRAAAATDPIGQRIAEYLNIAGNHSSPGTPNMPNDTEFNNNLHLIAQNVAFGRTTTAQAGQEVINLINRLIAAGR